VPAVQMKWHNFNIGLRFHIDTGVGLFMWILCFFGLLWMAQHHPAIERLFPVALTGLTGSFITFVIKRHGSNKIESQERIATAGCDKNGFTSADK